MVRTFDSVDKTLRFAHSNESYCSVLSFGAETQTRLPFQFLLNFLQVPDEQYCKEKKMEYICLRRTNVFVEIVEDMRYNLRVVKITW